MRIHHLNCGTMSPLFPRIQAIVYCLLIETNAGLVLVDTGFGIQDCEHPSRLMRFFTSLLGVPLNVEETAAHQIKQLGYNLEDVRHIVQTHLHIDHAGGLRDFPKAEVHVFKREYEVAMKPRGVVERGYDASHWKPAPKWVIHDQANTKWFGFSTISILEGLETEVLLVPLPGHTSGHCGVVTGTPGEWLFNCGDAASPFHRDVDIHYRPEAQQPLNFIPGRITRRMIGPHVPQLRALLKQRGDEIQIISSHDIYSFTAFRDEISAL